MRVEQQRPACAIAMGDQRGVQHDRLAKQILRQRLMFQRLNVLFLAQLKQRQRPMQFPFRYQLQRLQAEFGVEARRQLWMTL